MRVRDAITTSGMTPELLVIDTFSKNSGALDENGDGDVKAFIGGLDVGLRTPLGPLDHPRGAHRARRPVPRPWRVGA